MTRIESCKVRQVDKKGEGTELKVRRIKKKHYTLTKAALRASSSIPPKARQTFSSNSVINEQDTLSNLSDKFALDREVKGVGGDKEEDSLTFSLFRGV